MLSSHLRLHAAGCLFPSGCLTMRAPRPLTTQRLDTASLLSVPVRLRNLQYFCHSIYYTTPQVLIPTSLAVGTNALPSNSPPRNYRYGLLREFPATSTFLIPSSFPTTYRCIPTQLHTPLYRALCRPPPFPVHRHKFACFSCGRVLLFKKAGFG